MRAIEAATLCCLATAGLWAAGPADAADRPQFPPTRDVTVTYHLNAKADGAPDMATLAYSAALRKLRAEGGPGAMIVDLDQKSMVVMMTREHLAMRMPIGREIDRVMSMGSGDGTVARAGSDRVAGYACTVWKFTGKDGGGTGCITDDGVPLRGQGGDAKGRGGFEAVKVEYGPQPAAMFEVPPGFKQMELPAGMGHSPRPAQ
jgi:hypothetical protein